MYTLMQVLAVVTIVGALLSLYWFVEKFDRTVRNRLDTYKYIDRAPDRACHRDYAS